MFTLVSNAKRMTTMGRLAGFGLVMALALILAVSFAPTPAHAGTDTDAACWGQASAVFAQTGEMGFHSSDQDEPRLGLRNLARYLYDEELIEDDTMQALGAFVNDVLGLGIEACM